MFICDGLSPQSLPPADYILSPCALFADGLARVMADCGMRPVMLTEETQMLPVTAVVRRIVVFLPDTPALLLTTLQHAAVLLEQANEPLPMLLLSRRSKASWLWQTLVHQVSEHRMLDRVCTAASDLPVISLSAVLQDYIMTGYPSLEQLSDEEARLQGRPNLYGLTRRELSAMLGLLRGDSVEAQAKYRGISRKTLYNQRISGLKKMLEHDPRLAPRVPGCQVNPPDDSALSAFEREFIHAIHSRQIYPVFQPIVDEKQHLQGLELLPRWERGTEILEYGDLVQQVSTEYAWLVLTAFILREAVESLNAFAGQFYIAVNIPPAVTGSENLLRMLETARHQMDNPQESGRLVLEFSGSAHATPGGNVAQNITQLRQQGFHIVLSNCLTSHGLLFPVGAIRFNAYKLGTGIVSDVQRDPHSIALLKSLLYYCKLTGSCCIASGVDSIERFTQLRSLGMERFQGYFISPSVKRENLRALLRQLSEQSLPDVI